MAAGYGGSRTRTFESEELVQAGIDVQQAGYTGDLQHLLDPRIRDDEAQFGAVAQGGAVGPGESMRHSGASQKQVRVRSATTLMTPGRHAAASLSPTRSALARSISSGNVTITDWSSALASGRKWSAKNTPEGLHTATREIPQGRSQPG